MHRSRECSALSEVPERQVFTHYMCALCSEERAVIQARRDAVAKAAATKPAPKVKAFPRWQRARRDGDESGSNRPPSEPPSEPSEVQQGGEEEPGTTQGRSVSAGEESHNPLPSDVAGYDSDENPYNEDDGVRYISDQFLEDMRQEAAEELRRERYPHEELAEVSDPDLWMELHHHDYDSESISETQEPQGAASQEGTLTVSSNPPYVVRADPPEGERAAPPSGSSRVKRVEPNTH